jgi:hypothetical protein
MSDSEEWISAATALALLGPKNFASTRTICKRAHVGLIKARAQRFISNGKAADDVDVPAEFWWAEGEAALTQNWTTNAFVSREKAPPHRCDRAITLDGHRHPWLYRAQILP